MREINCKRGLTLIELLMLVLILATAASVTLPLGKIQYVREREEELKLYLKKMRRGIERFNANNPAGSPIAGNLINEDGDFYTDEEINDGLDNDGDGLVDEDTAPAGYPQSLRIIVLNHWLRRIPEEPFGNRWQYSTSAAPGVWKDFSFYGTSYEVSAPGDDIFDIRSDGSRMDQAINGSSYSSW